MFNNLLPDLYRWLQDDGQRHPELADELAIFPATATLSEPMEYPKLANLNRKQLDTFKSD